MNSLKLLIKNILLSPAKVCFPVIFLLEGEIGEGVAGEEWNSSLPASQWCTWGTRTWPWEETISHLQPQATLSPKTPTMAFQLYYQRPFPELPPCV